MTSSRPAPSPTWHVYVLRCADGSLYTGITTDVSRRLREHAGETGTGRRGAAYTRARRPVRLVWVADVADRSAAARAELAIKRLSRAAKERLVAGGDVPGRGGSEGRHEGRDSRRGERPTEFVPCKRALARPSSRG